MIQEIAGTIKNTRVGFNNFYTMVEYIVIIIITILLSIALRIDTSGTAYKKRMLQSMLGISFLLINTRTNTV